MNDDILKMRIEERYQMVEDYVKTKEHISVASIQHLFKFSFIITHKIINQLLANNVIYLNAPFESYYIVKK